MGFTRGTDSDGTDGWGLNPGPPPGALECARSPGTNRAHKGDKNLGQITGQAADIPLGLEKRWNSFPLSITPGSFPKAHLSQCCPGLGTDPGGAGAGGLTSAGPSPPPPSLPSVPFSPLPTTPSPPLPSAPFSRPLLSPPHQRSPRPAPPPPRRLLLPRR